MGINQVQMHEDIGLNFAAALRAFLRQDPNIIMVGEIRDFETAEIAVKAALTGHLVLSTLHTNDAPSTISRLLNMGIEPFLVTASVEPHPGAAPRAQDLHRVQAADRDQRQGAHRSRRQAGRSRRSCSMFKGTGCRTCSNTGYKGRIALYEVMPFYRAAQGAGAPGRVDGGTQSGGDPRRHEDAAHGRHREAARGRHHGRRSLARHRWPIK